jgi:1-acyl-sn-glycerol-3-phosphate acyltransferase
MDTAMLRGIWAFFVLGVTTVLFSLPVLIVVPLVPRWNGLSMRMARYWSRIMLHVVGAKVTYHDPEGALKRSRCVYIANHISNVDIWALGNVLPIRTRFVAKQELFRIPVLGWAMRVAGFISINRANRAEAIRSLTHAAEKIRSGHPVVLFPEGTRSRDGQLQPFKKGAFHLAIRAGVPVIPVAIRGTFEIMPPGALRVRPGPVEVYFEPAVEIPNDGSVRAEGLNQIVHAAIARRLDEAKPH